MPAIAAVAIPAVAGIAGGIIASKAAGRAAKAQQTSTQAAIDYERENQRGRQARYDAAMEDYNKQYDAWLEQFYGVKPASGGASGVHASAAGGPAGGPSPAMGAAPYEAVSPHQNGNSIAQLLMQMGQQQGDAATQNGSIWSGAINAAGQGAGAAFGAMKPKPQATVNGQFEPIGMSQAETGMTPYQPAQFGQEGGWNDWRKYLGTGQVF